MWHIETLEFTSIPDQLHVKEYANFKTTDEVESVKNISGILQLSMDKNSVQIPHPLHRQARHGEPQWMQQWRPEMIHLTPSAVKDPIRHPKEMESQGLTGSQKIHLFLPRLKNKQLHSLKNCWASTLCAMCSFKPHK